MGELDDLLGIEVGRVRREARSRAVLDALIDRQDAQVAGASETPVTVHRLEVAEHLVRPVVDHDVRPGQVQKIRVDRLAGVAQQGLGLVAKQLLDPCDSLVCGDSHGAHPLRLQQYRRREL